MAGPESDASLAPEYVVVVREATGASGPGIFSNKKNLRTWIPEKTFIYWGGPLPLPIAMRFYTT